MERRPQPEVEDGSVLLMTWGHATRRNRIDVFLLWDQIGYPDR
jgi:hypothetical protein